MSLPLILIPGLACSPALFSAQIPTLWRHGSVTIADHHHFSDMASLGRSLLLQAPPIFALAGLSMGGYLALEIMRQQPDRVVKLALLNTSARPDSLEATENRRKQVAAARGGHLSELMNTFGPMLFHNPTPELVKTLKEMAETVGVDGFARQQDAIISRADSRALLKTITCPTLVLAGEFDKLTPPDVLKEIASGITGSHYVEIPDCGHASTLEKPEAVTRALVEWLKT